MRILRSPDNYCSIEEAQKLLRSMANGLSEYDGNMVNITLQMSIATRAEIEQSRKVLTEKRIKRRTLFPSFAC